MYRSRSNVTRFFRPIFNFLFKFIFVNIAIFILKKGPPKSSASNAFKCALGLPVLEGDCHACPRAGRTTQSPTPRLALGRGDTVFRFLGVLC